MIGSLCFLFLFPFQKADVFINRCSTQTANSPATTCCKTGWLHFFARPSKIRVARGIPASIYSGDETMINPSNWTPFPDEATKIAYLKDLKLYPKSAKTSTALCYCGYYSNFEPQICDVLGYADSCTLVIQVGESLHCIHPECLAEMKLGRSDWLREQTENPLPKLDIQPPAAPSLLPPDFVVFDIETTGLARDSEIIEIAAIRVKDGEKQEPFYSFVQPEGELPDEIIELTGITPLDLLTAPPISDVLPKFLAYIGDSLLVGQNIIGFDLPICNHWAAQLGLPTITNPTMDTLLMARKKLTQRSYALSAIAKTLGVYVASSHQALADSEVTLKCFEELLKLPDLAPKAEKSDAPAEKKRSRSLYGPKAADIVTERTEFDENHPLFGKICVITGELSTLSREAAMQELADIGAVNADNITKKASYLVCGQQKDPSRKSGKEKKAEQYGIPVLTEDEFLALLRTPPAAALEETQEEVEEETAPMQTADAPPAELTALAQHFQNALRDVPESYPHEEVRCEYKQPAKGQPYWAVTVRGQVFCKLQPVKGQVLYDLPLSAAQKLAAVGIAIEERPANRALIAPDASFIGCERAFCDIFETFFSGDHFDCCSRYLTCSSAGHCTHPDFGFAIRCTYRQKLKAGKVFFGEHRNV